jgi:hypothetical protein
LRQILNGTLNLIAAASPFLRFARFRKFSDRMTLEQITSI